MTTTTVINAVTVGVTPSDASNIVKHTLAATSGAFVIQMALTAGALMSQSVIGVHYACIGDDLTANVATVAKVQSASFGIECKPNIPLQEKYANSDMYPIRGRYIYIWVEEGTLEAAATLTVKVIET